MPSEGTSRRRASRTSSEGGPGSTLAVCGFAGSLRTGSYNRSLLRAARDLAPDGMEVEIFDRMEELPLYNADVEAEGDPEAVTALKRAIGEADALLIATPEYNHGVPAVTKNAVDWASRPPRPHVLDGTPTAIMGASPGGFGTVRSQTMLRASLTAVNAPTVRHPQVHVSGAADKFDDEGRLTDPDTRERLVDLLEALTELAARHRGRATGDRGEGG